MLPMILAFEVGQLLIGNFFSAQILCALGRYGREQAGLLLWGAGGSRGGVGFEVFLGALNERGRCTGVRAVP